MTPLEIVIRELIIADGPMRLDRYMGLCIDHYYKTRDPFGTDGDFITAPEISQVFGELIGIWCVTAWQAMGEPQCFSLVELGPGRGTLVSDLLRAAKALRSAASLHLVETSPRLREIQRQNITANATWHDTLATVPEGPMLLVANEFFDAIPIRQFELRNKVWHERVIGLAENRLQIGVVPSDPPPLHEQWRAPGEGGLAVIESSPARAQIAADISSRLLRHPGSALIIDYGHIAAAPGDTLQAVWQHGFVPVTQSPGDCDITSHVDFEALGNNLAHCACSVMTQREFLRAMGLEQRTAALCARAGANREFLVRAMSRLADESQMGKLFKVLAVTSPSLALPYPFGKA